MGAIETLICYENLETMRYTLKNAQTGDEKILHLDAAGEANQSNFVTPDGVRTSVVAIWLAGYAPYPH